MVLTAEKLRSAAVALAQSIILQMQRYRRVDHLPQTIRRLPYAQSPEQPARMTSVASLLTSRFRFIGATILSLTLLVGRSSLANSHNEAADLLAQTMTSSVGAAAAAHRPHHAATRPRFRSRHCCGHQRPIR
jgi:hypothetical protein